MTFNYQPKSQNQIKSKLIKNCKIKNGEIVNDKKWIQNIICIT